MPTDPSPAAPNTADLGSNLSKLLGGRGLGLRAVPVFDLRNKAASTFFCVPVRLDESTNAFGHWLLRSLDDTSLASLDIEFLECAIAYAKRFAEAKVTAAVGTTVSYATLAHAATRRVYLDKLAAAPTLSTMVVKIDLIPAGTPTTRIAEIVTHLKSVMRRVFVGVDDIVDRTWVPGAIGAFGFGQSLNPADDVEAARKTMRKLLTLSASQGAISFVDAIVQPGVVEAAASEGVRFGTGPALSMTFFLLNGNLPKVPLAARA